MGLFDNLAQRRGYVKQDSTVKSAADIVTGGSWGEIFGGYSGGNPSFTSFNSQKEQLQAYVDWVYAATRYIAETCSTIDLRVFKNHTAKSKVALGQKLIYSPKSMEMKKYLKGTETYIEKDIKGRLSVRKNVAPLEELESHPILDLLDCPNPYMTRAEFFEMTFLHLELAGEAFWAVNRNSKNGPPTELWPLMPNLMSVVADEEKFIIGYMYTVGGQQLPFAPEDIIHHKYSNPNDLRRGMSPVQAAARIIDTDSHMADHNRRIFYNGATVDAVLYTENKLTDDNWKRLNDQWKDKYSGSANAHKTAILENGLKYQPMALSNRDLNFLEGMNFNRDMILAIFGVPKSLLGMDESMSRANAEAAEYAFSKNKLRPKMLRLTSRITEDLAIQFGSEDILVSFTDPVPDDKEFLLKEKETSIGSFSAFGWRTINEVRAEDGDDPIEGGDELWTSGTMIPIGIAAKEPLPEDKPAVAEEDPDSPNNLDEADDEEGSEDHDDGKPTKDDGVNETSSSSSNSDSNSGAGGSGSTGSSTTTGDKSFNLQKQISARDYPTLYDDIDIDFEKLGCIMMNLDVLPVEQYVENAKEDLASEDGEFESENEPHVTLLFGLLENGNKWKDKVDSLLKDWNLNEVQVDHVDKFDLGTKYAIVAHVVKTDELVDGHERLTLLPHINTFSEYKPHITLSYVEHNESTADKWVTSLNEVYAGKAIKTKGINYGYLEENDTEAAGNDKKDMSEEEDPGIIPHAKPKEPTPEPTEKKKVKHVEDEHDLEARCKCCGGSGEHDTGYECYRCDATGQEKEAVGDIPCGGRSDSDELWVDEDGNYRHIEEKPKAIHDTTSKVAEDNLSKKKSKEELEQLHKDYTDIRDRVSDKYETDFMKASKDVFEEQKQEVLANLHKNFKSYKPKSAPATKAQKGLIKDLFNKVKSVAKWTAVLLPVYRGAVNTAGNAAFNYVSDASTIGTSAQFSGADPGILKFYQQRTNLVSKGIDDTTDRLLKTSLLEGISNGEGIGELADRVESIYGAAAGYRAQRIARTESIDATTFASISAWEQSGVVSGKEWRTGGPNPCQHCLNMNGKVFKLGENFFNKGDSYTIGEGEGAQTMNLNYDNVDGPPLHPNCSCTLLPVLAS